MNVEVFSYSILASILGISIVFISLVLLSLLMVALKAVFQGREKKPEAVTAVPRAAAAAPFEAVTAVKRESHDWIMAAVGAFLAMEEEGAPRAESWGPGAAEKTDPWMNRAAFDRKIG